jgi:predicted DNA-binding transcriptional regulator AlpA
MTSLITAVPETPAHAASDSRAVGRAIKGVVTAKSVSCSCAFPSIDELLAAVIRAQRLKLITIKEVCERAGVCSSFVHAEGAAGRFPKPVKLGASKSRRAAARFVDGEISDWIEQRIAERDEASGVSSFESGGRMN